MVDHLSLHSREWQSKRSS